MKTNKMTNNNSLAKYLILIFFFACAIVQNGYSQIEEQILYLNVDKVVMSVDDVFSLYLELGDAEVDSIVIEGFGTNSETGQFSLEHNGVPVSKVTLKDDGEDMDLAAGDNVYTVSNLSWSWRSRDIAKPIVSRLMIRRGLIEFYQNNTVQSLDNFSLDIALRLVDYNRVEIPIATQYSDSIQYTDHVINVVRDQKFNQEWSPSGAESERLDKFGTLFCDDNDELIFSYTYPTKGISAPAFHFNDQNDVEGICKSVFNSNRFPCEGVTVNAWGNLNASLYVHEYFHRYAMSCTDFGLANSGSHFNPIEFSTNGFNPAYTDIQEVDQNTYSLREQFGPRKYNSLDLYFLGLGDIDEIPWPIRFIKDASFVEWDFENLRAIYTGELVDMEKDELLAEIGGMRNPLREPDILRTSYVVYSNHLLTPRELAYYEHGMAEMEVKDTSGVINNIYFATSGRLNHITTIRAIPEKDTLITISQGEIVTLPNGETLDENSDGITGQYFDENIGLCGSRVNYIVAVDISSVDENKDSPYFSIQNNPAGNYLIVNSENKFKALFFDLHGSLHLRSEISKGSNKIDVSTLPSGVYIICSDNIGKYKFVKS